MANENFTQLPTVTSALNTDIIAAVQAGVTVQETLAQVITLANGNLITNYAGNPNGNIAGTVYNLCEDTTQKLLFVCTTTGTASTAVWTPCVGELTNGQLLIGSTGATPVLSTITAGAGVSVVNGAGSITISGTAASIGWNVVTTNTQMVVENGYFTNSVSSLNLTLPTTAVVGSALAITGLNTGGWVIVQNAGQNIMIGNAVTSTGAGGSITSTVQGDSLYLVCAVANTTWISLGGIQGNVTIA